MSMMGRLQVVRDSQIDRLIREPHRVAEALGLGNRLVAASLVASGAGRAPSLRVTWGDDDEIESSGVDESLDLEKTWHGLHFLLTGQARGGRPPLCYLLRGGIPIGTDLGYGPARALRFSQVTGFHRALQAIDEADLRRRFDPIRMTREGVYPGIWQREPAGQCTDWLCESFHRLREFVAVAVTGRVGILICLM